MFKESWKSCLFFGLTQRLEIPALAHEVRTHTDHVGFKFLEQTNIRTQVFQSLPGNADHHAGTHLITAFFKPLQALQTVLQLFRLLVGNVMKKIKELMIGAFKARQITKILSVAACLRPLLVHIFRLVAETQSNS